MPIEFKKNQARLHNIVSVEDAENLLGWLQNKPSAKVDMTDCTHLHPANLQVLMASRARISAWPQDPELQGWLASALRNP